MITVEDAELLTLLSEGERGAAGQTEPRGIAFL